MFMTGCALSAALFTGSRVHLVQMEKLRGNKVASGMGVETTVSVSHV